MKRVILLVLILILTSVTTIAHAEDVLIIHQGYANSHSKWKNRLEDAGHTVTSINITSASFPTDTTSYEQIYDVRHGQNSTHYLTTAQENAYKALLARGGTLYLQTENPGCCNGRNQNIIDFIEDDLGGGTITYHTSSYSSNSITVHNSNESWLSGFSGTVTFSAGGVLTAIGNGTWFAKDGNGNIVGAVWYSSDLSSTYTGKVVVITDINYNSHSSYYTNNNKNWMNAMRTMLASTYNAAVSITSSQSTTKTTAFNKTVTKSTVYISQSGANFTSEIKQAGENNFIMDVDWDGAATIAGDSITLTVHQGNVSTTGNSDDNGLGLAISGNSNNITVKQGDRNNDQGSHRAIIDVNGNSNVVSLDQKDYGTLSKHFFNLDLDGDSNNITAVQKNNSQKTMFIDVNSDSNTLLLTQQNIGLMYLDLTLNDNGHDVTITQKDQGDHAARVTLGGYSTDFDLLQQGNTTQNYELNNACSNALGCTINVTQGSS